MPLRIATADLNPAAGNGPSIEHDMEEAMPSKPSKPAGKKPFGGKPSFGFGKKMQASPKDLKADKAERAKPFKPAKPK